MKRPLAALTLLVVVLAACSGVDDDIALTEPLRIEGATFEQGKLPGSAGTAPTVTAVETVAALVRPGETGNTIDGRTSTDAVAIAVSFTDLGTGYWVEPVGAPDPTENGELDWTLAFDIGYSVPAGRHDLAFVAIDAAGHPGPQRTITVCVETATPDNLAACSPTAKLPAAVVSLTWDTDVDLDLIIDAPDNSLIDAKSPGGAGILDRDSNANCVIDSINREDAVFQDAPPAGSYLIYVNMFATCGNAPVHYTVTLTANGVVTETKHGTLLEEQASASGLGTYVTELDFQ